MSFQKENDNKKSSLVNRVDDTTYLNCEIASDTPKKLDFLFLVIETLQINAADTLFLKAKNIGLSDEFSSRVEFWKIRCSNPLRKSYAFSSLSTDQIDSLVKLISSMADNLYPLIRQLLSSKESETLNKERWFLFSNRLKSLIRERMNLQRSYVVSLLSDENNTFFRELLLILSLSCGKGGADRLKASLYYQT
ncbi:DUF3038 domain-containing protein [Prochlorococcus marinus]|uniref:DUF3038 domain-containing protein n=1 Tax=Prochlorococcus marinus TaxID=1219 RepID=UPI0021C3FD34|nr:DUF3038 domain-containing protein [Prochlorococcus marinus]